MPLAKTTSAANMAPFTISEISRRMMPLPNPSETDALHHKRGTKRARPPFRCKLADCRRLQRRTGHERELSFTEDRICPGNVLAVEYGCGCRSTAASSRDLEHEIGNRLMMPTLAVPATRRHARICGALLLAAAMVHLLPGPVRGASAHEIAEALARCQDEDRAAALRAHACTHLISTTTVDDDIRAEAFLNRGIVHLDAGETDRAIADFTDATRLNPQYPAPYAHRADAYKEKGQFDRALADMTTVIALRPDDPDAYADRGEIQAKLGNTESAIADFRAALRIDPHHDQAHAGLRGLGVR